MTTLLESMSPLASKPSGPVFSNVELVEARIGVVRIEHAQVLFGVEPAPGCDKPVVRLVEVPDAFGLRWCRRCSGRVRWRAVVRSGRAGAACRHARVPAFSDAGVRGNELAVHVAIPDVVVAVDRVPHGLLHGPVGSDDRLVGAFAEPIVQADAVLFELAGEDAFDLSAQPGDVAGSSDRRSAGRMVPSRWSWFRRRIRDGRRTACWR